MITEAQKQGLGQFAEWKFTLYHPDDHTIALLHEGRSVAIFSQGGATEESIQAECTDHLVTCHGWDGCLWKAGKNKNGGDK